MTVQYLTSKAKYSCEIYVVCDRIRLTPIGHSQAHPVSFRVNSLKHQLLPSIYVIILAHRPIAVKRLNIS